MEFNLFFHFIGIIIALGAVTVIDSLGFISRKNKVWTQITIKAHHVTKPLIWIGTIIVLLSWIFMYENNLLSNIKSMLLLVMILNGSFLSFYVSPRLDKLAGKKVLLPNKLQSWIIVSMLISFISWWSFVFITILMV